MPLFNAGQVVVEEQLEVNSPARSNAQLTRVRFVRSDHLPFLSRPRQVMNLPLTTDTFPSLAEAFGDDDGGVVQHPVDGRARIGATNLRAATHCGRTIRRAETSGG